MKRFFTFFLFLSFFISAQTDNPLFVPVNVNQAIENQTRTYNGKPGSRYWINKADYNISVKFDMDKKKLIGIADITYYNESPDSLSEIVFKLYQDLYKKGGARDFPITVTDVHDGIDITSLIADGDTLEMTDERINRSGTTLSVKMEDKIPPSAQSKFHFEWNVTFPVISTVRMGVHTDSSAFIAYWYPQVSVYDDIDGWDMVQYTGMTEAYNDFNNYDVTITANEGYNVWATGMLENPEEVYSSAILEKYNSALNSDTVINIVTAEDLEQNIFAGTKSPEFHFTAKDAPDFAFAIAKNFLWDGSTVVVDSSDNRTAFVDAAYDQNSEDFYDVCEIGAKTMEYFSFEMPAVPYPFVSMTVFNGAGGMEFPMIVNDGTTKSYASAVGLTSHEIAHTYFPFYMGTNERKYAWMDEGWARMLPSAFQEREGKYSPVNSNAISLSRSMARDYDTPPMVLSYNLQWRPYRTASYGRPHAAYTILHQMLGNELFLKAMKEYIHRWNGKHPVPYDFFYTFNEIAGENLNWFWKPWFFEFAVPDLAIEGVVKTDEGYEITIRNSGNLPMPVELDFLFTDESTGNTIQQADIWKEGNKTVKVLYKTEKNIKTVTLNEKNYPDVQKGNNFYDLGTVQ